VRRRSDDVYRRDTVRSRGRNYPQDDVLETGEKIKDEGKKKNTFFLLTLALPNPVKNKKKDKRCLVKNREKIHIHNMSFWQKSES